MENEIRKTVHYSGRVQNVGFRRSVARVAEGYGVVGTIKNLHDGRVKLVAECSPGVMSSFLEDVAEVMDGYIEVADIADGFATGEFDRFKIVL